MFDVTGRQTTAIYTFHYILFYSLECSFTLWKCLVMQFVMYSIMLTEVLFFCYFIDRNSTQT